MRKIYHGVMAYWGVWYSQEPRVAAERSGFKSQLCALLRLWCWTIGLTSLLARFLSSTVKIIVEGTKITDVLPHCGRSRGDQVWSAVPRSSIC